MITGNQDDTPLALGEAHGVEDCVFCGGPATGFGEHALPHWFLGQWVGEEIHYSVSGAPVVRRDGLDRTDNHMRPTSVPVCSEQDRPGDSCNGWLNTRYEVPGRPACEKAMFRSEELRGREVIAVAEWWMKTMLMYVHRRAQDTAIGLPPVGWDVPDSIYHQWRVSEELPTDVSLWIGLHDPESPSAGRSLPELLRLNLGATLRGDDGGRADERQAGWGMPSGKILMIQLLYHPLMDITHPLEAARLATRLWPDHPSRLNLQRHPILNEEGVLQFKRCAAILPPTFDADSLVIPALQNLRARFGRRLTIAAEAEIRRRVLESSPKAVTSLAPNQRLAVFGRPDSPSVDAGIQLVGGFLKPAQ